MKTFFDGRPRLILAARALAITLAGIVLFHANAGPTAPAQSGETKYFGDEFADAQRALAAKPAEEAPPTF